MGCNFVRLAHYPHNEYMVELAEKMGLLVWDEIPVYQHIEFATPGVPEKMSLMLKEMIRRDRNRCSVFLWSIANETYTTTKGRDEELIKLSKVCRQLDSTRLITTVLCSQGYENNTVNVWEKLYNYPYTGWSFAWLNHHNTILGHTLVLNRYMNYVFWRQKRFECYLKLAHGVMFTNNIYESGTNKNANYNNAVSQRFNFCEEIGLGIYFYPTKHLNINVSTTVNHFAGF